MKIFNRFSQVRFTFTKKFLVSPKQGNVFSGDRHQFRDLAILDRELISETMGKKERDRTKFLVYILYLKRFEAVDLFKMSTASFFAGLFHCPTVRVNKRKAKREIIITINQDKTMKLNFNIILSKIKNSKINPTNHFR
jgi:hypothetical protein